MNKMIIVIVLVWLVFIGGCESKPDANPTNEHFDLRLKCKCLKYISFKTSVCDELWPMELTCLNCNMEYTINRKEPK